MYCYTKVNSRDNRMTVQAWLKHFEHRVQRVKNRVTDTFFHSLILANRKSAYILFICVPHCN